VDPRGGRYRRDLGNKSGGQSRQKRQEEKERDPAQVARDILPPAARHPAPHLRAELTTVLRKRGIPTRRAEVLDRYDDVGLIDDAAFARAW